MEEATQQGADNQSQAVSEDSDFARRITSMENGEVPTDEGGDEAADDSQSIEGQADDATQEADAEPTFKIKVDGEERELTQSELIAEAQKAQAANKRFEEAAQLKKQFEAEKQQITQQSQQEREMLQQALNHFTTQLQTLMKEGEPDWDALLEHHPTEYLRVKHVYEQRQMQLQQAQAAQAHLAEQQKAEAQQRHQAYLTEQRQKVLEVIPDWNDPAKFVADKQGIEQLLAQRGFTQQEISSISDHRTIAILRELHQLKTQFAKQDPALKKVEKLPPKVEKSGTGARPTDGRSTAMQRLSKSGKAEDAASLIASFL